MVFRLLCIGFLGAFFSCSEPVSSNDLDASRVDFEVTIEPDWGNVFRVNASLRPDGDDLDYVLLNGADSIYTRVGEDRARLVLDGSDYEGRIEANGGDTIEVVVYLAAAKDHLISSVVMPPRINLTKPLAVSARYLAEVFWTPSGEKQEVRSKWIADCKGAKKSLSTSYSQTIPDSIGVSYWDLRDFVESHEWGADFGCKIENRLERVERNNPDFGFRGGWLLAIQSEEQEYAF